MSKSTTKKSYYVIKVLHGTKAPQQSDFTYELPTEDGPGPWMTPKGKGRIQCCARGLHGISNGDIRNWIKTYYHNNYGARVFIAEVAGAIDYAKDHKIAAGRMRLIREIDIKDIDSSNNTYQYKVDKILERIKHCTKMYKLLTLKDYNNLSNNPSNPDNKLIR